MKWEISNPSDYCTMESDVFAAAVCAAFFLGEGRYGLKPLDNEHTLPVFILGGAEEWVQETFGVTLGECIGQNMDNIIRALESVDLPSPRTSMNDIQGRAMRIAQRLKEVHPDVAAP